MREHLVAAVVDAAKLAALADNCSAHYTCEGLVQDALWGCEDIVLSDGKPLCPWIVRPGKCQPEVAMMLLKDAINDLDAYNHDPALCAVQEEVQR